MFVKSDLRGAANRIGDIGELEKSRLYSICEGHHIFISRLQRKHHNTAISSCFTITNQKKELSFLCHIIPTPVANLKALWMDPQGFLIFRLINLLLY